MLHDDARLRIDREIFFSRRTVGWHEVSLVFSFVSASLSTFLRDSSSQSTESLAESHR